MNSILKISLISLIAVGSTFAISSGNQVRATYHNYEGDYATYGAAAMDNATGFCGIRYSALNRARITAVNGLQPQDCGKCLKVTGITTVYVVAIDQKADPGLDLALTAFSDLFPGANPLDPQVVDYEVVDDSFCAGYCFGSVEECTVGVRNLLPAYLLPPVNGVAGATTPASTNQQVASPPITQDSVVPVVKAADVVLESQAPTPSSSSESTNQQVAPPATTAQDFVTPAVKAADVVLESTSSSSSSKTSSETRSAYNIASSSTTEIQTTTTNTESTTTADSTKEATYTYVPTNGIAADPLPTSSTFGNSEFKSSATVYKSSCAVALILIASVVCMV